MFRADYFAVLRAPSRILGRADWLGIANFVGHIQLCPLESVAPSTR